MPDVVECAYAAGLFDGEGCVHLYYRSAPQSKHSFNTSLSVSGVDLRPLHWLEERWGGRIGITDRQTEARGNRRPLGLWRLHAKEAEVFANDIQPFLLVKREQVDLWLQARSVMRAKGWNHEPFTDDEIARREFLVERIAALKRGVPSQT